MTDTQKTIASIKQTPILSGIFAVVIVLTLGVAIGYSSGFDAPAKAYAQLAPVIVTAPTPPPIVVPPPPVIVPVITPVVPVVPVVTPPEVSPVTVTGGSGDDTVTGDAGGGVEVSPVTVVPETPVDTDTNTPPCCTEQAPETPPTTVSPVTVTPETPVDTDTNTPPCCTEQTPTTPITPVTTPVIDTNTPPCCTVPVTTPPVLPPPTVTPPIIPPIIPPVIPPVVPPSTVAECKFLTASPTEITAGDAVTLSWKTVNATSVSITNIAPATVAGTGTFVDHPTKDTTYVLTATGVNGTTAHCTASVKVKVTPPPGIPAACTFLSADKTLINAGDAVTLSWKTVNATGVSITNIAPATVAGTGTYIDHPTVDTTYVLTATGVTGSAAHCTASVKIKTTPPPPVFACLALTADKTSIKSGEAVVLTWTTSDNAPSISINGVSSTDVPHGSKTVNPTTTTTYTGVVPGATGSNPCVVTVTVSTTPPPGGNEGKCVLLSADKTSINPGEEVVLTWQTQDSSSATLNGETVAANGTKTVNPTSNTTYHLSVPDDTDNVKCTVEITVSSTPGCTSNCGGGGGGGGHHGGGGSNKPRVSLASAQPLASVYLSQIPYTGLDLGPIGTALYWLTLVAWSLAAAYLILFGAMPYAMRRVKAFGGNVQEALNAEAHVAPEPEALSEPVAMPSYEAYKAQAFSAPVAPVAHIAPVQMSAVAAAPAQGQLATQGFKSFATGEALTIDDIVKGLSRESGMVFAPHMEQVQEAPAAAYDMDMAPRTAKAAIAEVSPAPAVAAPVVSAEGAAPLTYSDDISGFLGALLSGDRDTVFGTLRNVNRTGGDTQEFLSHAVCALDDAYRARIDGTPCHPEIARITSDCATNFLERLVSSLATAIDSSYSAGITGAKLAATRALSIVNG